MPDAGSNCSVCEATTRPTLGVHLHRDACLAHRLVVHRDDDARPAGHVDALQRGRAAAVPSRCGASRRRARRVEYGSSSTSHCDTPRTVVPAAKYQSVLVVFAHGTGSSVGRRSRLRRRPRRRTRTARPRPGPEEAALRVGAEPAPPVATDTGASDARSSVSTESCGTGHTCARSAPAPLSGCTVTTASASVEPRFDSVIVWSPVGNDAGRPGQYHAVDSAPGAGRCDASTGAIAGAVRRRVRAPGHDAERRARRSRPRGSTLDAGFPSAPWFIPASSERAGVRRTPVRRQTTNADDPQNDRRARPAIPEANPRGSGCATDACAGSANAFVQSKARRGARSWPRGARVPAAGRPPRPRAAVPGPAGAEPVTAPGHTARRRGRSLAARRDVEPAARPRADTRVLAGNDRAPRDPRVVGVDDRTVVDTRHRRGRAAGSARRRASGSAGTTGP